MDNFFNHDVASWITKSISGMEDAEAEMFSRFFVYELHKADLDNNRRTLNRHVEEVNDSLLADLKPELRELVRKAWDGPETPWEELYGKPQPRSQGTGRWVKIGFEAGGKSKGPKGPKTVGYTRQRGKHAGERIDLTTALNRAGQAGSAFSDRWTEQGDNDYRTNERTYRRVQAGAELLEHVPNKGVKAAAQVGQFAGQFGPEAEKVVGPAARRTAYRYRGTERMPDARLQGFVEQRQNTELKRLNTDADFKRVGGAKALTPEQKMKVSEDAAAAYLYSRLPKKSLSSLQVASGKLPPSEGVIINSDGDIVTQAVGYNEDHYLPFNLKNLKGLQGGSYVRTRSTGGLTTEDIYTGLISGARSVTVVSRSGVFTIDFADDLRGGRRYSDKARQMIGRYAQTLDAVQSKQVSRRGLTPDEKAEIREEVEADADIYGWKTHEIEAKIKEKQTEYSKQPHVTAAELDSVKRKALEATESYKGVKTEGSERMPDDPAKRYKVYYGQFMDEVMEEKAKRMYQLDADGYEAAQQALREQFPYFIADTSAVKRLPSEDKAEDKGYVRPNYNRPKAVQAGYFDAEINGRGKFNASELHYQNYGHKHGEQPASAGEAASAAAAKTEPKKVNLAEAQAMGNAAKVHRQAIKEAADIAASIVMGNAQNEKDWPHIAQFARENKDITLVSPLELQNLMKNLETLKTKVASSDVVEAGTREAFRKAMNLVDTTDKELKSGTLVDRSALDPAVVSKYPQKLGEEKYHTKGYPAEGYVQAYDRIAEQGKVDRVPTNPTDEQLFTIQTRYAELHKAAKDWAADNNDVAAQTKFLQVAQDEGIPGDRIKGIQERAVAGDVEALKVIAAVAGKKANTVAELRSIVRAAGGSLNRGQSGLGDSTLKGELVSETNIPAQSLHKEVRASIANYPTQFAIQRDLEKLANAMAAGNTERIEDTLEDLPEDIANKWRRRMRGQSE